MVEIFRHVVKGDSEFLATARREKRNWQCMKAENVRKAPIRQSMASWRFSWVVTWPMRGPVLRWRVWRVPRSLGIYSVHLAIGRILEGSLGSLGLVRGAVATLEKDASNGAR